jgi:hypothetical protein
MHAGMGVNDVRMTTRFKPDNLMDGLTGAVHECGHSLYEQGCNTSPEFKGTKPLLSSHHIRTTFFPARFLLGGLCLAYFVSLFVRVLMSNSLTGKGFCHSPRSALAVGKRG